MRLVLLGAPGSGKGTQATRLREHLQVPHISTGELLRAAVNAATALGLKAKAVMESGGLVSDDIVLGMLEMEIPYLDANRDRLLIALAKSHQQEKQAEYRLIGLRHTLARKNLELIEQRHRALVESLPQP